MGAMPNQRPKVATRQIGLVAAPERVDRLRKGAEHDGWKLGPWLLELGDARCDAIGLPEHVTPPEKKPLRAVKPRRAAAKPKKAR
jgi:hypothetical protein